MNGISSDLISLCSVLSATRVKKFLNAGFERKGRLSGIEEIILSLSPAFWSLMPKSATTNSGKKLCGMGLVRDVMAISWRIVIHIYNLHYNG